MADNDAPPPRRPRRVLWDVVLAVVVTCLLGVDLIGEAALAYFRIRWASSNDMPPQDWLDLVIGYQVHVYAQLRC